MAKEKKKPVIEFPKQTLWFEFWRICEIGLEMRLFGWSDRTMPTTEALEAQFGTFDFKLNVSAYLTEFMEKWTKRHRKSYEIERPAEQHDQFVAMFEARKNCDGAIGTFFHVMRTAWYEMHKPIDDIG
jgi:hypothetical protein|tara:strand:+ start:862 stop:1245 length:384 start_codon:yes stop_codon:yes gene_type:complete